MANLDTANKRSSAFLWNLGFGRVYQTPDASFDGGDRQQTGWIYRGILASAQAAIAFMNDVNTQVYVYLRDTVGLAGTDNTSLVRQQMNTLTGEATARLKAIIVSAGTVN